MFDESTENETNHVDTNNTEQSPEQVSEESNQDTQQESVDHEESAHEESLSYKEKNLRALREAREKAERERDEAYKMLQYVYQSQGHPKPQYKNNAPEEEDDTITVGNDDFVEGKHLSKVDRKIKKLEQQIRDYQQMSSEYAIESQIKSKYPDYDNVVNNETVEILKNKYPEIAKSISQSTDLYSKAVSAYTLMKKLGISPENETLINKQKIRENNTKPKSTNSISESPLNKAAAFADKRLTDELRDVHFKEMMEAIKNRS